MMTLRDAALMVLASAGQPLTAKEVWDGIVAQGMEIPHGGKTPDATVGAWLYTESRKDGGKVRAVDGKPRRFILAKAVATAETVSPPKKQGGRGKFSSRFYAPCLEVLRAKAPTPMKVGEILNAVLAAHPELPWKKSNGAVRAALLRAVKHGTPIRLVGNSQPPLFYVGEGESTPTIALPIPPPAQKQGLPFLQCAEKVLREFGAKQPMHYREITAKALENGWLQTQGAHPEMTMNAQIGSDIRRRMAARRSQVFVQHGNGYVGLTEWMANGLRFSVEEHNKKVRACLLAKLHKMKPDEFETLICTLLDAMDFIDTEVTRTSGDGGIDVRGTWRIADGIQIKMAVQAKRWKHNVHSDVVQNVRGSISASERGMIITTSDFSPGARKEAENERRSSTISLVNGEQLVKLLEKHRVGVASEQIEILELDEASGLLPQD